MELNRQAIVVTGAGQGIGRAIAIELASAGARLGLIDLEKEKLNETAALCKSAGGDGLQYVADVTAEEQVIRAFNAIEADLGEIRGLVNNAGIVKAELLVSGENGQITSRMSLEQWQAVIDVNLTGTFLCGREAASRMIKNDVTGCIINISSLMRKGSEGQSNYSASKAGVAALATVWAKELARYGIRAAAIAPGGIMTEIFAGVPPEALKQAAAKIPLKRLGEPEEVAHTARFIFENDYFSGRVIELDGGLRL